MKNRARIMDAPVTRWHRVTGPLTAVMAVLADIGWVPVGPDRWTDCRGVEWTMEHFTEKHMRVKGMELLQKLSKDALSVVEQKSARYASHSAGASLKP